MALGPTQPLTEMSTRNISWGGKGSRCVGLTTLPSSCADCLEIWEPQPHGTLRACPVLYRDCFTFITSTPLLRHLLENVKSPSTYLIFFILHKRAQYSYIVINNAK
jgi:hypothetical protein